MSDSKKILVIGGSGFIGQTLVPYLIAKGYAVTVLNRGNRKPDNAAQLVADRNVEGEVKAAAEKAGHFDAIIDSSAYTLPQSQLAWKYFAGKTNKWIHISSAAVYKGHESTAPHKEEDETGGSPIWGSYGKDKSAIDDFLLAQRGATQTIILRPPYIYGPHNSVDRETFVWSRAEAGLPVIMPPMDQTLMQFLHVEDLADCIYTCINTVTEANAVYNVAGSELISIRDWVALMLDVCTRKKDVKVLHNTLPGYDFRTYFPFRDSPICLNINSVSKHLNWEAKYSLREGFSQTYSTRTASELESYLSKRTAIEKELAAKLN